MPSVTCDCGIISPPSLRFLITLCGCQCFTAGTQCDPRFARNQNCGHCCNRSVTCRGSGLECGSEPAGSTRTSFLIYPDGAEAQPVYVLHRAIFVLEYHTFEIVHLKSKCSCALLNLYILVALPFHVSIKSHPR